MRALSLLAALWLAVGPVGADTLVLRRGNSAEPDTLDPQLALTWQDWNIVTDLFVGLTTLDAGGATIPGMAESWQVSEDGLTYRFQLRSGLRWSDGHPLTAADFEYSLKRLLAPETAASRVSEFYAIENGAEINAGELAPETLGVTAVDELTLEMRLAWPVPHWASVLGWAPAAPVPAHVIAERGKSWTLSGVSNGPYRLAEWRPYEHVRLTRNVEFYDAGSVQIDEVVYYPTDDGVTAFKRFRAGELDINYGIVPSQLKLARQSMAENIVMFARPVTMYLVFNLQKPPFDDLRVREALSMAIDRSVMAKVLGSGEQGAYELVAPGVADYGEPIQPHWASWTMEERRQRARDLLAQAGYDESSPLELTLRYDGSGSNKRLGLAAAGLWRGVGVEAALLSTDTKVHFADLKAGNFDVARIGLSGRSYSAETFLQVFEHDSPRMNPGRYRNPAFNALMAKARGEADGARRGQILRQASARLLSDHPFVPLHYYVSRNLVQTYVRGYEPNPYDVHPTRFITIDR